MKITMVVVLYKQSPSESKTLQTLKQTLPLQKENVKDIELIIYDNSPNSQLINPSDFEGIHITYQHDSRNLGIAAAYNFALAIAKNNKSQWLLLLDHDTELTNEYMNVVLNLPDYSKEVAGIVPKVKYENTLISPVYSHSLRPLLEERPSPGIQETPVMAINSGMLISIDFLNDINGFNEEFPLDYLDHWLFFKIYEEGLKVLLLDVTLEHELSVMDYSRISLKRYQSILDSEMNFYKNYKKELLTAYRTQLAKRLLKQVVTVKNKQIAFYTLKRLFSM